MLKIRYKFLFVIGLLLFVGSSAAVVTNAQNRRPKNIGHIDREDIAGRLSGQD